MEDWKELKISDVIEEISMGPFGSNIKVDNFIDFGVPVLNGSNLQGFKLNEESFNYVSQEKADSLGKAKAHRGDVVITHRGTLGQIVYIPNDSKYEQYVISQSQFRLKLKKEVIRPDFFVYFFHTRLGQHRILMNASQVGVPALARPTSTFKEVLVPVPSLDVQSKVMDILNSIDDKIECNRRINENLEQQALALFKSWFVDFEPFKDQPFVESELGMIPQGWKVGCLSEFGKIVCGKTPSKAESSYYGGNIPFIKIPDMHNNVFVLQSEDCLSELGDKSQLGKRIPPYSVLVSCIATVGLVCMNVRTCHTNQQINTIIPNSIEYRYYLYQKLVSLKEYLINLGRGGTATLNVNTRQFSNIRVVIPSDKILSEYHYRVSCLFDKIEINSRESRRLAELRDTLLPKLMSGEINVNEVKL